MLGDLEPGNIPRHAVSQLVLPFSFSPGSEDNNSSLAQAAFDDSLACAAEGFSVLVCCTAITEDSNYC